MVQPIKPTDIVAAKKATIPDIVLESVNELIAVKWDGHQARVKQDELVALILGKTSDDTLTSDKLYKDHMLDFEDIYREAGWIVEYDRPAYNETYPAAFTFSKKRYRATIK